MSMQGCVIPCGTVEFFQKSCNLSRSLLTNINFYCGPFDITNGYVFLVRIHAFSLFKEIEGSKILLVSLSGLSVEIYSKFGS